MELQLKLEDWDRTLGLISGLLGGGKFCPNLFAPSNHDLSLFTFDFTFDLEAQITCFDQGSRARRRSVWNNLASHSVWSHLSSCLHQGLCNPASNNKTHLQTDRMTFCVCPPLHLFMCFFHCQNQMHISQKCPPFFGGQRGFRNELWPQFSIVPSLIWWVFCFLPFLHAATLIKIGVIICTIQPDSERGLGFFGCSRLKISVCLQFSHFGLLQ